MQAPLPYNEYERLEALRQYEILDTADEVAYDDLVMLTASMSGAPMVAISIVDDYRQWFKARLGLGFRDTDRDQSICSHAILKPDQILVVPDTILDSRFSDNPLVLSKPNIRFYAGAPLINPEGLALGALCIMDRESRTISANQIEMLKSLSRQVVALLELRRSKIMLRKQADNLMKARQDALVAEKAKTAFLTNISHEFRTPVNGIVGVTSILMDTPLSERQRHLVDTVEKSAEGLLNVISNIVEYSRNDAQKSELSLSPVSVSKIVENVSAMMSPVAMTKQLRFISNVDADLRQTLMGNEMKLQQLMSNLVGNAIKFTDTGTVEISVKKLAESQQGLVVRFEVRDSGVGVPKDKQTAIFEEFVQVDQGTERNYGGVGLGLSISRQLARQMGTEIDLKSDLGMGSTFGLNLMMPFESEYVELDAVEMPVAGTRASAPATQPTPVPAYQSKGLPRILVADDNEVNCLVISSILEHQGCQVTCVESGEEALQLLRTDRFDLVFMDIQMPGMDGVETTKAIRGMPYPLCEVPIVALSASILDVDQPHLKAAGMNDLMSKPISERAVKLTLGRWLIRSEATSLI